MGQAKDTLKCTPSLSKRFSALIIVTEHADAPSIFTAATLFTCTKRNWEWLLLQSLLIFTANSSLYDFFSVVACVASSRVCALIEGSFIVQPSSCKAAGILNGLR